MLVVFRYAQPILISRILQLLASHDLGGQSYQLSCTIVIISTVVYIGQAVRQVGLIFDNHTYVYADHLFEIPTSAQPSEDYDQGRTC
jgi:hypothetical protein